MSVAEIKNDLILQTEDESVLEMLGVMFRSLNQGKDWWAEDEEVRVIAVVDNRANTLYF